MTISMWIATLAWALMVTGFLFRKTTKIHVPLVLSGIMLDVTLVLFLQITRSAVQTALKFELTALKQIHIGFSSAALLLYIPTITLGCTLLYAKRKKQPINPRTRKLHITIAVTTLCLRTLGFIFMFSMWRS